mmetsp:Transcript_50976/g.136865  ORF Transcript_50976/g.136865 Transcript_50976/m.136865 type:complete len:86 (-) Transcript_50976:41-298(-)
MVRQPSVEPGPFYVIKQLTLTTVSLHVLSLALVKLGEMLVCLRSHWPLFACVRWAMNLVELGVVLMCLRASWPRFHCTAPGRRSE